MLRRLFVILLLLPFMAFGEPYVAGKDYEIVNDAVNTTPNKPIKVTEFFSFGCPWCYRIEPALNQWVMQQNGKVQFLRIPVVFNKEWVYFAKAYYTAELLGMGDKLNPLLFKAIQTDKLPLNTNQAMIDFFIEQGVNKEIAESAFTHSTTIDMKVNEGNTIMGRFRVNAVPAIVVNNRFKTDLQMAQNEERLLKILDYLVTQSNLSS